MAVRIVALLGIFFLQTAPAYADTFWVFPAESLKPFFIFGAAVIAFFYLASR